jgi:hypothetical protein
MLAGSRTPSLVVVYAGREKVYAASFGCDGELPTGEYGRDEIEGWLNARGDVAIISDDPGKTFLPSLGREVSIVRPDASEVARVACLDIDSAVPPMKLKVFYHRSPLAPESKSPENHIM